MKLAIHNYLVAWIDLLGQGRVLRSIPVLPKNDIEKNELSPPFKRLQTFRDAVRQVNETFNNVDIPSLDKERKNWLNQKINSDTGVEFLSDAALFKIRFSDPSNIFPLVSVSTLFHKLSPLMIAFLAEEMPVRCAVEIGRCAETEGGLYGQSVAAAYHLESKCVGYPRIVLGSNLIDYLKASRRSLVSSEDGKNLIDLVDKINLYIENDVDGMVILNYLKVFRTACVETGKEEMRQIANKSTLFIKSQLIDSKTRQDTVLYQRYSLLENFFKRNDFWME